ncbi:ribonucleases P/MRP protein subunit POP1 [Neocloeon triangulifer]|uniref:ribonucleases P/MRP protein subunit POP1 n=1 Tax=Neocloeon triangulifer TaxID=2078957 RepID=UPI00286F7640|nr:ribonucleases P/MRP protein subunit POP1 [Neocloeon triangulifer]
MDVGTSRFLESRIEEIRELSQRINAVRPMLPFQRLPRHMKRRVMGHTSKRIPRSILEQHLKQQAKGGLPKKMKMPSRRHRRRPKNARAEFERRQEGKSRWLETHLWHAKRFHMMDKWGFKLAHFPNDKSWRACWRAATSHCLMFDLSYWTCIEIVGEEKNLINILKRATHESCEANVCDAEVLQGKKEGQLVLFKEGEWPTGCLGCVKVMWKPINGEEPRRIWLWSHPGAADLILKNLKEIIGEGQEISAYVCDGEMNRFRLVGPLAMPVLRDSLMPYESNNLPDWLDQDLIQKQSEVWQHLRNSSNSTAGSIFGLTVNSVSSKLIPKRKKSLKRDDAMETDETCESTDSQLWIQEVRSNVSSSADLPAPIILVNHPAPNEKHGGGWDVITPKKHGIQLWLRMIKCGARVGALRELQMINWNLLNLEDLCFYPDTILGQEEEEGKSKQERIKFEALPPAKRIGVPWFSLPWQQLLNEWALTKGGQFFVLRDSFQLKIASNLLDKDADGKLESFEVSEGLVAILVCLEDGGSLERGTVVCLPHSSEDLLKSQEEDAKLRNLQRQLQPEDGVKVSEIYSRKVAGFVVEGGFSFHRGCHAGVAFVSSAALKELFATVEWNGHLQMIVISKRCPLYKRASVRIV